MRDFPSPDHDTSSAPRPRRRIIGLVTAALVAAAALITTAPTVAEAHTPDAELTCDGWSVSLTNYDRAATAHIVVDGTTIHEGTFNGRLVDAVTFTGAAAGLDEHSMQVTVVSTNGSRYNFTFDDAVANCNATPPALVTPSEWQTVAGDCTLGVIVQSRTVTTTAYVWNPETEAWVPDAAHSTSETESQQTPMTDEEIAACAGDQPPALVTVTTTEWVDAAWLCEATTTTQTRSVTITTTPYTLVEGAWILDDELAQVQTTTEVQVETLLPSEITACPATLPDTGATMPVGVSIAALAAAALGMLLMGLAARRRV